MASDQVHDDADGAGSVVEKPTELVEAERPGTPRGAGFGRQLRERRGVFGDEAKSPVVEYRSLQRCPELAQVVLASERSGRSAVAVGEPR